MKKDLTPGEIMFLVFGKKQLKDILMISLLDLIVRKILICEKFEIQNVSNKSKVYFLKLSCQDTSVLEIHERKIIKIFNHNQFIALKDVAIKLSDFCNYKFRVFAKGYRYENYILKSLLENNFIVQAQKKLLGIIKIKRLIMTSSVQSLIKEYKRLFRKNNNDYIKTFYSSDNWLFNIASEFKDYFDDAILRRENVTIAIAELNKTYWKPILPK